MDADIHTLYESDFYRILDFKCRCTDCRTSKPEYGEAFTVSFVRKGNFLFNIFRHSLDSYNGCILISKPEYERTVTHTHEVPDECTIFEFTNDFFREILHNYTNTSFLKDNDRHSTLIHTTAETELLHFYILQQVQKRSAVKLQIDHLVMEVLNKALTAITDYNPDPKINARFKKNHLITIEKAKEYITNNFTNDISLMDVANHCFVSAFHFARIFKAFTTSSPHQFLLGVRLKHAELLLRNTSIPASDIAFLSGFNSVEHFTAAFRQRYQCPPASFRSAIAPV